jgi:hypothetical protein
MITLVYGATTFYDLGMFNSVCDAVNHLFIFVFCFKHIN